MTVDKMLSLLKEEKINKSLAGFYSRNINMKGVAKGVYFIRMEADVKKYTKTNKFILM